MILVILPKNQKESIEFNEVKSVVIYGGFLHWIDREGHYHYKELIGLDLVNIK